MTGTAESDDTKSAVRVDVDDSGGVRVLWMRTTDVCVGVVPGLGGRVLSLATRAGEHLFRNPDLLDDAVHPIVAVAGLGKTSKSDLGSWINWGGDKTWPAPQGWSGPNEWPGPPDPVLDGGPFSATWSVDDTDASVETCSPDDPRTGLRICRRVEVTPGISGYRLTSTFTNTGDREVRWAIWQVVQLPGNLPAPDHSTDRSRGVWVGTGPMRNRTAQQLIAGSGRLRVDQISSGMAWVSRQERVGKVGFPNAVGWVAHAGAGRLTALRFVPDPAATYPDRGSRVEVWLEHPLSDPLTHLGDLRPRHRVAECEVLGPLQTIPPRSSTHLVTDVIGCACEGPVRDVSAAAAVLESIVVARHGSGLYVTGTIGAFRTGPVTLGFSDRAGRQVGEVSLGMALAGIPFQISSATTASAAATSVVVRLGGSTVAGAPASRLGEQEGHA